MAKRSKKRPYKTVQLSKARGRKELEKVVGRRAVFAIDVAKEVQFGVLMMEGEEVVLRVKWRQPSETRELIEWVGELGASKLEVAMEPSGTYGDALRSGLWEAGIEVYRVSPKKTHDLKEVFDGVPGSHDAKSASLVGKLHMEGRSEKWRLRSEAERDMRAAVEVLELYQKPFEKLRNVLEAKLARHWPELLETLVLGSVTMLELVREFGSFCGVRGEAERAYEVMRKAGGSALAPAKIEAVLESSRESTGVAARDSERRELQSLCEEMLRLHVKAREAKKGVERLSQSAPETRLTGALIGKCTAAVVVSELGSASNYASAREYEKSVGLNLKGNSSGKHVGRMKISKRGSSRARRYLYMAAMRLVQHCPIAQAWYEKKVRRDGKERSRRIALVAVMRKLVKALWHVGRGQAYDATKLFDVSRLSVVGSPISS